jgi:NADH-quinone oxidoreductase subunit M
MSSAGFPFLTVLVLVPAGGAAVLALVPTKAVGRWFHEVAGVAVAGAVVVVAAVVAFKFKAGDGGYQLVSDHVWAQQLGIHWSLGIDGISLFLVLLTAVLFPLAMLGARARRDPRSFVAWLLLLESACLGSFVSLDLVFFFLFFELTLVPAYFLIAGWGFARRGYAAIKFFVYTFAGSAFLLVGILSIAFLHQSQTGEFTFELPALMRTHVSGTEGVLLFLAFTAAFAVKAPLFPFHTWSPDAYAEAPSAGAVLLAAVMAKLGTYGVVRFDLNLFPQATRTLAPLLLTLAVIGILYGALVACAQRDLKRLLAYSSLAQIGFIVMGTFALNAQGLTGGVLQMVNHGLIIATLFIVVGWIYERRQSWQIPVLKGLQAPAPVLAGVFTVAMMASIGLPGLNGFVGEFLVLIGTFVAHRWWAVVATAGVVIAAVYLLWAYQQAFHGQPEPEDNETRDLGWNERLIVAPLIVLIVALGVFPKPVLDRITPSVNQLVVHVDRVTHTTIPAGLVAGSADRPAGPHPAGAALAAPGRPHPGSTATSTATAVATARPTGSAAGAP